MESGNLTPDERGLCEEFLHGPPNELRSYAWLKKCLKNLPARPGYPRNERLLNRALSRLQRDGLVTRLGSSDRSAWYLLTERWAMIPTDIQRELAWKKFPARSVDGSLTILALGPECYPESVRNVLFKTVEPSTTGEGASQPALRFDVGAGESKHFAIDPPLQVGQYSSAFSGGLKYALLTFAPDASGLSKKARRHYEG